MRTLLAILLLAAAAWPQMGPAKPVDTWLSKRNQKRLRIEYEALPEYKPTKLPDGTEEPPRAPWPFVLYIQQNDSKGNDKLRRNVILDTRFVLATRAVRPIRIKPEAAVDLEYLARVSGIKDPTLVIVSRDFKVVGVVKNFNDFMAKKVLPLMAKAADAEYTTKLGRWVPGYIKLLEEGEKLWKTEMKVDRLREKAGAADPVKQKKYDREADELEADLEEKVASWEDRLLAHEEKLALRPDEEEPLPTTVGTGRSKRELTPEELEAVRTYREFARNKNPIVRAAATEDLGAVDSPVMVQTILEAAKDLDQRVTDAAGKALGRMKSDESLEAMLAGLQHPNAKSRTAAILGFAGIPRGYAAAVPAIIRHLESGNDEVRRACIMALENLGDPRATDALIAALSDRQPGLRVMAATALGTLKASRATTALCEKLSAPDWSLRKAAAEALGKIRARESIEPLLVRFEREEGLMVEVLHDALVAVTGQDFQLKPANWRRWWDRWGPQFKVPTDEEVRIAKKKAAEAMKGYFDPRKRRYHKIETLSRKMVFVLDISASMRDKIVIPPYAPDKVRQEYPDRVKWNIAEKELTEILATLDRNVYFNIITFAGEVKRWRDGLVQGTQKTSAIKFVARLKPMEPPKGGGTRRGRPGAKGGGGPGDEQKTNTYAALMAAFGQADEAAPNWKARTKVDTIFIVTDGVPTIGKITDVPKLVDFFTELNRSRGIIIHVITFDRDAAKKLRPLAERNGGQCVLRGWDGTVKKQ